MESNVAIEISLRCREVHENEWNAKATRGPQQTTPTNTSAHAQAQFALTLTEVDLDTIQGKIDKNLLDPTKPITMKHLYDCGAIDNKCKQGVKLLGSGNINQAINIEVTRTSEIARKKIESKGGLAVATWYTELGLRALFRPEKFDIIPKRPAPPNKYVDYYTSDEKRGYLSQLVQVKKLEKQTQ